MLYFFLAIPLIHACATLSMDKALTECIKIKLFEQQNSLTQPKDETCIDSIAHVIQWIVIAQKIACTQKKYRSALYEDIINTKILLARHIVEKAHYLENINTRIETCNTDDYRIARTLGTFLKKENFPKDLKKKIKEQFFNMLELCCNTEPKDTMFLQSLIFIPQTALNALAKVLIGNSPNQKESTPKQKKPIDIFIKYFFAGMIQDTKSTCLSLNPKQVQQCYKYIKNNNNLDHLNIMFTTGHFNCPKYALLEIAKQ